MVIAMFRFLAAYLLFGIAGHFLLGDPIGFRCHVVDTESIPLDISTVLFGESDKKGAYIVCRIELRQLPLRRLRPEG